MWASLRLQIHSCFFQAEDGIRDADVTGVQTCALPICVKEAMEKSMAEGSQTFEEALAQLVRSGRIDRAEALAFADSPDRKSTRLNSSHVRISYAVFCLKKKKTEQADGT